jgi:O-antigen/teichoic acid export membrane protein
MAASVCSAAMITGFAPLMKATDPADYGAASGVVLAAVIVSRAPVLVLLSAFQGPIIATLVQGGTDAARTLYRWIAWGILATMLVAVVGAIAGPAVVRIIFGSSFSAGGRIISCAIVGASLLALLTVIGWLALARGRHSVFLLGWTAALAATVGTLSIDVNVDARAGLALVVGPFVGVLTLVLSLSFAQRRVGARVSHA